MSVNTDSTGKRTLRKNFQEDLAEKIPPNAFIDNRISRRHALSSMGKAVAAVAGIIVVGGVAYYVGTSTSTPATTTATSTATSTATATQTTTATATATQTTTAISTATSTATATQTTTATSTATSTVTASPTATVQQIRLFTQKEALVNALLQLSAQRSVKEIGVQVTADQLDFSQMAPQLTAMTAGGNIPYDLVSMAHDQLGPFNPYLRPMDDLVDTYKADLSVYTDALVQQLYKRDRATGRFGTGNLIGIPYISAPWGLQYNTKLYIDAGLVDSTGKPTLPDTWDKFAQYMQALTKPPNQYGMAASYAVWWNPAWMHASYVASRGGAVLDKDFRPLINDSKNVESVQFWSDAVNVNKFAEPTALTTDDGGLIGAFNSGKVANMIYWFTTTLPGTNDPSSSSVVGQVAAGPLPGDGANRGKVPAGGWAHEMPQQVKHPDAAFRYAIWESTLEVEAALASSDLSFVRKASFQDPRIVAKFPYVTDIAKIAATAYAEPSFEIQQGSQIWSIYLKHFQDVVAGNAQAQAAMDACHDEWDTILKAAGYYS